MTGINRLPPPLPEPTPLTPTRPPAVPTPTEHASDPRRSIAEEKTLLSPTVKDKEIKAKDKALEQDYRTKKIKDQIKTNAQEPKTDKPDPNKPKELPKNPKKEEVRDRPANPANRDRNLEPRDRLPPRELQPDAPIRGGLILDDEAVQGKPKKEFGKEIKPEKDSIKVPPKKALPKGEVHSLAERRSDPRRLEERRSDPMLAEEQRESNATVNHAAEARPNANPGSSEKTESPKPFKEAAANVEEIGHVNVPEAAAPQARADANNLDAVLDAALGELDDDNAGGAANPQAAPAQTAAEKAAALKKIADQAIDGISNPPQSPLNP